MPNKRPIQIPTLRAQSDALITASTNMQQASNSCDDAMNSGVRCRFADATLMVEKAGISSATNSNNAFVGTDFGTSSSQEIQSRMKNGYQKL